MSGDGACSSFASIKRNHGSGWREDIVQKEVVFIQKISHYLCYRFPIKTGVFALCKLFDSLLNAESEMFQKSNFSIDKRG